MPPCYHAALAPGRWSVTAREGEQRSITSEVVIDGGDGICSRSIHSVELTLEAASGPGRSPGRQASR